MQRLAIGMVVSCLGFCTTASGQGGIITTLAGKGSRGFSGDGGPALTAELSGVMGVAADASGNVFIVEEGNGRVRKVSPDGIITSFVGGAGPGPCSTAPATSAYLFLPSGGALDAAGNLFIADRGDNRVCKVSPGGVITAVAGNGNSAFSGDGGPATSASLGGPTAIAADASGNLFIVDADNNRVRRVSPDGIITTVAGSGKRGFSGDGGLAPSASLNNPWGVAVDASGNIFISDLSNRRIRKVSPGGIINTIAGNGDFNLGGNGDGGPASAAILSLPFGLALDAAGNLYIADGGDNRIRKISTDGTITTVAGNGSAGFSGDGGPATLASLNNPHGVAVDPAGNFVVAEYDGNRVRRVSANSAPDTIEHLVFTGTASCQDSFCRSFGSGPITGTYSLNVTAQAIVGPWSFTAPFGTISSGDKGASASINIGSGIIQSFFRISTPTVEQNIGLQFSATNPQQLGSVQAQPGSRACINIPGGAMGGSPACAPDYLITGATSLAGAPPPPSISPGGIVPVYSTVPTIQPGEWVTIYGANLATSTVTVNSAYPTTVAGTSVTINGKPGYLWYVSPTQINLQAPSDTATGPVPVVVTSPNGTATSTVRLAQFGPSFSLLDSKHVAGIILRTDGSGAYGGGTYDIIGPKGNSFGYPTVPAKSGDNIALFAVGLGPTNPTVPAGLAFSGAAPTTSPVSLLINNVSVTPSFAGLTNQGLYQINFSVPVGIGAGDVPLVASVGGVQTPAGVVISVQAGPVTTQLQSLTLSSNSVAGGGTVTGTVLLSLAASAGGAVVALSSSSSAASVPATVTVPAGASSATFTVSAGSVSSNQTVTIAASYGGTSAQAGLTVTPAPATGKLNVLNPSGFSVGIYAGGAPVDLTTYTLTNSGTGSLSYTVTANVPWLSFSPSNGTLGAAGSVDVTISANAAAASLSVGTYNATVTFISGATSITRAGTVSVVSPPPGGCEVVSAGPYQFRVVNMLSTDAEVDFGKVVLPGGQVGSLPFGMQMRPNECDIVGLPQIAVYTVDVSRSPNGTVVSNSLTFNDTTSGFVFNGRSAYTLIVTSGSCSASADQGIKYLGQSVYSVCVK